MFSKKDEIQRLENHKATGATHMRRATPVEIITGQTFKGPSNSRPLMMPDEETRRNFRDGIDRSILSTRREMDEEIARRKIAEAKTFVSKVSSSAVSHLKVRDNVSGNIFSSGQTLGSISTSSHEELKAAEIKIKKKTI